MLSASLESSQLYAFTLNRLRTDPPRKKNPTSEDAGFRVTHAASQGLRPSLGIQTQTSDLRILLVGSRRRQLFSWRRGSRSGVSTSIRRFRRSGTSRCLRRAARNRSGSTAGGLLRSTRRLARSTLRDRSRTAWLGVTALRAARLAQIQFGHVEFRHAQLGKLQLRQADLRKLHLRQFESWTAAISCGCRHAQCNQSGQ